MLLGPHSELHFHEGTMQINLKNCVLVHILLEIILKSCHSIFTQQNDPRLRVLDHWRKKRQSIPKPFLLI